VHTRTHARTHTKQKQGMIGLGTTFTEPIRNPCVGSKYHDGNGKSGGYKLTDPVWVGWYAPMEKKGANLLRWSD
jgi:hypothetical protein